MQHIHFNCTATNTIQLQCNKYTSTALQQIQFNCTATNRIQTFFFGVLSSSQPSTASLISSRIFAKASMISDSEPVAAAGSAKLQGTTCVLTGNRGQVSEARLHTVITTSGGSSR